MNRYIQIEFPGVSPEQSDLLIALLSDAGFTGFEEDTNKLRAFINEAGYNEDALYTIISNIAVQFSKSIIEETNWNQVWETSFDPVLVDDFAAIRADFHKPVDHVKHEIVITPKMSFGTGHHATTYLMIQQMKELDMMGKTVFDFGTGTGVLAILAEKSGARKVVAMDNDQWSYVNAAENIERNNCTNIELHLAGAPISDHRFDIILANINKNIIIGNLGILAQQILPGGCLLVSGLLVDDEKDIIAESTQKGLCLISKGERGNWLVFKLAP